MKKLLGCVFLGAMLVSCGVIYAAKPTHKAVHRHHPNLTSAHRMVAHACERIAQAQKANEFDLGGHAAKAKELLEQANAELKLALEAANENHSRQKSGKAPTLQSDAIDQKGRVTLPTPTAQH